MRLHTPFLVAALLAVDRSMGSDWCKDNYELTSLEMAGREHTCGIEAGTGKMHCFGSDTYSKSSPPSSVYEWSAVSAGNEHTCGIEAGTSKMHCFGYNEYSYSSPPSSVQAWAAVSAGGYHTCGIEAGTRKMHCFGSNLYSYSTPPSSVQAWSAVSAGQSHTCGIEAGTRKIHCFGSNMYSMSTPPSSVQKWSTVSAGGSHTCGIEAGTRKMHCFGSNLSSESSPPSSVQAWAAVSVGNGYTCGIEAGAGKIHCFGSMYFSLSLFPSNVAWSAVSAGGRHRCGIKAGTGEMLCIGGDMYSVIPPSSVQAWSASVTCRPPSVRFDTILLDDSVTTLDLADAQIDAPWPAVPEVPVLAGWEQLSTIVLPAGLKELPANFASGAPRLRSIDLSRCTDLTAIPQYSLGTDNGTLTGIILPSSISTIEPDAFTSGQDRSGPSGLQSLDLSMTQVSSLEAGALRGLTGLTSILLPSSMEDGGAGLFEGSMSSYRVRIYAPGLQHLHQDAFLGAHGSPGRLELVAPMLQSGPTGLFQHLGDLTEIQLTLGADFAVENGTCGFFDGLDLLASLSIEAPGAYRIFGKTQDLALDGFRDCAFASTLRSLDLQGLDLRRSAWTEATFAGFSELAALRVVGSSGDQSFDLVDGALSPLVNVQTVDLSGNGFTYLAQLSFAANDAMEHLNLYNNPIETSHAQAFANLFKLQGVNISESVGAQCNPGTYKAPVEILGSATTEIMCVKCPAGTYCEDGLRMSDCPKGTYSEAVLAASSSTCLQCPDGTTTVGTGTSTALDCIAVVVSCPGGMAGQNCEPCLPGTSSPGGNVQSCETCKPGTASVSKLGSIACSECPSGTYMPSLGAALTSSCIRCGAGLRSDSGSALCSGCPGDAILDSSTNECVNHPPTCSDPGTMCLPGVPEPVPALAVIQESLAGVPLPGNDEDAFASATTSSYSSGGSSRRLRMNPQSVVDPKVVAALRAGGLAARRLQEPMQNDYSSGAEEAPADEPEPASDGGTDDEDGSDVDIIAWIVTTCVLCVLLLLLLVPAARPTMHTGLRMIDSMAQAHKPVEYAAVRRITTAMGGWFTVMAVLVALTSSTTLVLDFAYRNSITTDGLQVATAGASGAVRAASARSNVVLDAVLSPTSLVACSESYLLTVSSGRASLSAEQLPRDAPAHSMLQLAATATVQELPSDGQDLDRPLCWLRATCDDCGLSAVTVLDLDTHWAVQAIGWRLATQDAEGRWSSVSGTAVSPSADPLTSNTTVHLQEMLDARSEQVAFVGHVLDDTRAGSARSVEGFRVQDLRSGATSTRSVDAINPATTVTRLSIQVSQAGVFATTNITPAYTLAQVASSIVGLTVGILGGFKAVFAMFEKVLGPKVEWLCGRTGLVDTEEEAMEHRRQASGPLPGPKSSGQGSGKMSAAPGNAKPMPAGVSALYGQSPMWSSRGPKGEVLQNNTIGGQSVRDADRGSQPVELGRAKTMTDINGMKASKPTQKAHGVAKPLETGSESPSGGEPT